MKSLKRSLPIILVFIAIISDPLVINAQKSATVKEVAIKNLIDSQRYVFHAENVTPMSGRQRFLTSDYIVNISKDTIISDLPYFGRAYSAPINSGEGGIKFTSTDFGYEIIPRKKGGWDITIKPKDVPDVQRLTMTIFENGTASLQVTSTNRQPISFNGYVTKLKMKK
ncbi:MAG: DUF4251 domain-containing protein [Ferruginibacter sp.]